MKLKIICLLSFIVLSLNAGSFTKEIGVDHFINFQNFQSGIVIEYPSLETGLHSTTKLENKALFKKISKDLFLKSDSINAPEGFEIKVIKKSETYIVKCMKIRTVEEDTKKENCAIKAQLEGSLIDIKREKFYLSCIEGVISN